MRSYEIIRIGGEIYAPDRCAAPVGAEQQHVVGKRPPVRACLMKRVCMLHEVAVHLHRTWTAVSLTAIDGADEHTVSQATAVCWWWHTRASLAACTWQFGHASGLMAP